MKKMDNDKTMRGNLLGTGEKLNKDEFISAINTGTVEYSYDASHKLKKLILNSDAELTVQADGSYELDISNLKAGVDEENITITLSDGEVEVTHQMTFIYKDKNTLSSSSDNDDKPKSPRNK